MSTRMSSYGVKSVNDSKKNQKIIPGSLNVGKNLSFEDYVETYCKGVALDNAISYAQRGEAFLLSMPEQINSNTSTDDITAQMSCVMWCLLKRSYDNKEPFGKGMFNIAYEDPEVTKFLFDSLIKSSKTYSRLSTHYRERVADLYHRGIDINKNSEADIPLPWKFKTICFGLCKEPNGTESIYLKPEKHGVDFRANPLDAFWHGVDLIRSFISSEKIKGTQSYRETEKKKGDHSTGSVQKGRELRFTVLGKELRLESKEALRDMPNSRKYEDDPLRELKESYNEYRTQFDEFKLKFERQADVFKSGQISNNSIPSVDNLLQDISNINKDLDIIKQAIYFDCDLNQEQNDNSKKLDAFQIQSSMSDVIKNYIDLVNNAESIRVNMPLVQTLKLYLQKTADIADKFFTAVADFIKKNYPQKAQTKKNSILTHYKNKIVPEPSRVEQPPHLGNKYKPE